MTEVGIAAAGSDNQIVVLQLSILEENFAGCRIDADDIAEQDGGIFLRRQHSSNRLGNISSTQRSRCHLEKQWLEQMMVASVNHGYLEGQPSELSRRAQSPETGADNYHLRFTVLFRCRSWFHNLSAP